LKRSEYIALGTVGVLVAAMAWPRSPTEQAQRNAQSDGIQTLAFATIDECRASNLLTEQQCTAQFTEATSASIADAPKYTSQQSCEAEYGASNCRSSTWQGASVFVPALVGVLVARSLFNNSNMGSQPLYPARTGPAACPAGVNLQTRPECAPRSGSASSSSGASSSYYSTGSGRAIGRIVGSMIVTSISERRPSTLGQGGGNWSSNRAISGSMDRASRVPGTVSSSSTVARSGFGSTGSSFSSGS
jgi:uncharacterized protein YgiB involved in biofilm formation